MGLIFGAKAQVLVGIVCFIIGITAWVYWGWITTPTKSAIFHVSMFFGLVACYAIIATGLGFKATERVETVIAQGESNE